MFPLGNFHDGLYSHEKTCFRGAELARNAKLLPKPFMKVNSHEIAQLSRNPFVMANSHEIALVSRNPFVTVNSHEISQKTALKTPMQTWQQHYFHEGGRHGELS